MPGTGFLPEHHGDDCQESMSLGPSAAPAIGSIILLMCADSTRLTVDIMIHRQNLPGYIIAH